MTKECPQNWSQNWPPKVWIFFECVASFKSKKVVNLGPTKIRKTHPSKQKKLLFEMVERLLEQTISVHPTAKLLSNEKIRWTCQISAPECYCMWFSASTTNCKVCTREHVGNCRNELWNMSLESGSKKLCNWGSASKGFDKFKLEVWDGACLRWFSSPHYFSSTCKDSLWSFRYLWTTSRLSCYLSLEDLTQNRSQKWRW